MVKIVETSRLPRGTVIYDSKKGKVRFRVQIARKGKPPAVLDSGIKVPEGTKPRGIRDIEKIAQTKIDKFVLKVLAEEENPQATRAPDEFTLREWFEFANQNIIDARETSLESIKRRMENHWLPRIGGLQIRDISSLQIQPIIREWESGDSAHSTIAGRVGSLSWYMRRAAKTFRWIHDPLIGVEISDRSKRAPRKRWVTPTEFAAVREHGESWAYGAILIALFMGLRRSEVMGLRWKSIDLTEGKEWLHVCHTIVVLKGLSIAVDDTKTPAGNRKMPIPRVVADWLRKRRQEIPDAAYVFPSMKRPETEHMSMSTWNLAVTGLLESAGLREDHPLGPITPHILRHSFATYLGLTGLDNKHQNYLFGHEDEDLREQLYRKPVFAVLPAAMQKVERLILGLDPIGNGDDGEPVINGS